MTSRRDTSFVVVLTSRFEGGLGFPPGHLRENPNVGRAIRRVLEEFDLSPQDRASIQASLQETQSLPSALEASLTRAILDALNTPAEEAPTIRADAGVDALKAKLDQALGASTTSDPELDTTLGAWEHPPQNGLAAGTVLGGKYRIIRQIGMGAFGAVYEAEDEILGTRVAIKYMHRNSASHLSDRAALRAEARRVTRLNHPNIVDWKVFDECEDGSYYFVMELLTGDSLDHILTREKKLPPKRAGEILLAILDALRTAHKLSDTESILHLDLKPQHIFIENRHGTDHVKVIDFGIGQYVGAIDDEAFGNGTRSSPSEADSTDRLSSLSFLPRDAVERPKDNPPSVRRCHACTPEYASPEQCTHMLIGTEVLPLDGRSDLYSLGIVGFQMLTGRLPFETPKNRGDWLAIHRETPPMKIGSRGAPVPKGLAQFIDRCLEKDRDKRFLNTDEAYEFLASALRPPKTSTARLVTLMTLAFAVILVALVAIVSPPDSSAFDLGRTGLGILEANEHLFLGPDSPTIELQLVGIDNVESLRLTSHRDPSSEAVSGWGIDRLDSTITEVIIGPQPGSHPESATVFVEVRDDETARYSEPLRLEWIDPNSWNLSSPTINGIPLRDNTQAIDPARGELTVQLSARNGLAMEHIEAFEVAYANGRRLEVTRHPDALPPFFVIALDSLQSHLPGTVELTFLARDRAQSEKKTSFELDLAAEPLQAEVSLVPHPTLVANWNSAAVQVELEQAYGTPLLASAWMSLTLDDGTEFPEAGPFPLKEHVTSLPLSAFADRVPCPAGGLVSVRLADTEFVRRTLPDRGQIATTLPFRYRPFELGFSARLQYSGCATEIPLATDAVTAIPSKEASILLRPECPQALSLYGKVSLAFEDGEEVTLPLIKWLPGNTYPTKFRSLPLPEDGSYELKVSLGPYDEQSEAPIDIDPDTLRTTVHVDTQRPRPRLSLPTRSLVRSGDQPTFDLSILGEREPSLSLKWHLSPTIDELLLDKLPQKVGARNPSHSIALPIPLEELPSYDGKYSLSVTAIDNAGNEGVETVSWEVARCGPEIFLTYPTRREWPEDNGSFLIRARVRDNNPVHSVRCQITDEDTGAELTQQLESKDEGFWEAQLALDPSWSKARVSVQLTSSDIYGNTSRTHTVHRDLCAITDSKPLWLINSPSRRAPAGVPASRMVLIQSNEGEYVLGGRGASMENDAFREMGLYEFRGPCLCQQIAVGDVPDYYLDEKEVTRREFLAFVSHESGYPDRKNWPSGFRPRKGRRNHLLKALDGSPDLPVTGVFLSEAKAYARWVGKRIPTRLELEFATRGGTQYRLYSNPTEPGMPSTDRINYRPHDRPREAPSSPWACGRGDDKITRELGRETAIIWNLGANVREWTVTPAQQRDQLEGETAEVYIFGGSHKKMTFDALTVTIGSVSDVDADKLIDVGFRCAY